MLELINNAKIVVTDSGGLQKEAYFLEKNCITIRTETEWVETLNNNMNILAFNDSCDINNAINFQLINNNFIFQNHFGNGDASLKIAKLIKSIQC